MPDDETTPPVDEPREDDLAPSSPPSTDATPDDVAPGGYSYTVVDDAAGTPVARGGRGMSPNARRWLLLAGLAVVPAVIVGVAVWFLASSSGSSGNTRVSADVANVVNAFTQGNTGTTSTRYEGKLAPGYPGGLPVYPGARLVSSVSQVTGSDAGYLAIYDTPDARSKVSSYYEQQLSKDPWQIVGAQDAAETALHQFSKIDDPNITGLVLTAQSTGDELTTIVYSLQVSSGANAAAAPTYAPPSDKALPNGFPQDKVSSYPSASLIESSYQTATTGKQFTASFVTTDDASKVIDFYKAQLASNGLTVQDADASQSSLKNATAVTFTDTAGQVSGQVTVGDFAQNTSYKQIDVQVQAARSQ